MAGLFAAVPLHSSAIHTVASALDQDQLGCFQGEVVSTLTKGNRDYEPSCRRRRSSLRCQRCPRLLPLWEPQPNSRRKRNEPGRLDGVGHRHGGRACGAHRQLGQLS